MDYNNASNTRIRDRIKEMVQIALMTAMIYLSVSFLHIPYGSGGVVHLGDSMIFVAAILFGTRTAVISGALGMTMFDAFSQFAYYAPYTFVIKAVMALIVGLAANGGNAKGKSQARNIIGIILAGAWGVVGYFGAETFMYQNIYTAATNVLGNIIQVTASGAIALVLLAALKKTRYFENR